MTDYSTTMSFYGPASGSTGQTLSFYGYLSWINETGGLAPLSSRSVDFMVNDVIIDHKTTSALGSYSFLEVWSNAGTYSVKTYYDGN